MFKKFIYILVIGAALLSTQATARPAATPPADENFPAGRTLLISGVIAGGNILPIGKQMLALAKKSSDPIALIINSPGGEINTGLIFLNYLEAAKALGAPVKCYVSSVAASLAFHILTRCTERHALTTTLLLWHRARLFAAFTQLTAPIADSLAKGLQMADDIIIRSLRETLGIPEADIMWHLENETMHTGISLHELAPNFIISHRDIPGLLEKASDNSLPHNQQTEKVKSDEVIYIDPSTTPLFVRGSSPVTPTPTPAPSHTPAVK